MKLSLVLPAFNEATIARESVRAVDDVLSALNVPYEIIVADDGSIDETTAQIESAGIQTVRVLGLPHRGKGAALTAGFVEATGQYVGFLDIDLEISESYLPDFVRALDEGADVVIASKVLLAEEVSRRPLKRRLTTSVYNWLARTLLGTGLTDHQAGLKLFRRSVVEPILPKIESEGWLWDTEILARCIRAECTIREIGVATRVVRPGHVRLVGTSWEMFTQLLRLSGRLDEDG